MSARTLEMGGAGPRLEEEALAGVAPGSAEVLRPTEAARGPGQVTRPAVAALPPVATSEPERLCAAQRGEARVWSYASAFGAVDRNLAHDLATLWERDTLRTLGFARAIDMVREYTEIEEGRARWLAKVGRTLKAVPGLDREALEGDLTLSQVLELGRVVGAKTPPAEREEWIGVAHRAAVRDLRRMVAQELKRRQGEDGASSSAATGGDEAEEVPNGEVVSIPVPARVAELWHLAVELTRKAAGRPLPLHQCAEWIGADFFARFGDEDAAATERHEAAREREECVAALGRELDRSSRRLRELCVLGDGSGVGSRTGAKTSGPGESTLTSRRERWPLVDWDRVPSRSPAEPDDQDGTDDAWLLAKRLQRTSSGAKEVRLLLGVALDRLHRRRDWRRLGFATFDEYCTERLGFGRRCAELHMQFGRGARRFRIVRRAYFEGRLSYTSALKLLPILHESTEAAWVEWASGKVYREVERVVEYAEMYMLPEAALARLESHARLLSAGGGDANAFSGTGSNGDGADGVATGGPDSTGGDANAFAGDSTQAGDPSPVPLGYPLPPRSSWRLPSIAGLPPDLIFSGSNRLVARIRFWAPTETAAFFRRVIRRCREVMGTDIPNPWADWPYLEVLLVQFVRGFDTPAVRRQLQRYKALARDDFRCSIPTCTARAGLNEHHLWYRGRSGTNELWNLVSLCAAHHLYAVHLGSIKIAGWAPRNVYVKQGIDPRTGEALLYLRNDRHTPADACDAAMSHWRRWWRRRTSGTNCRAPTPPRVSD